MIGLIRSELLKVLTTKTWWLFGIGLVATTGLTLFINGLTADSAFNREYVDPDTTREDPSKDVLIEQAANIFTSGQYLGCMFVLLLAALVVTNEFYHQTATATFLTSPNRTPVIAAKLVIALAFGGAFWLITTLISLPVGFLIFDTQGYSNQLGEWEVQRSIIFNLLVYLLWAIVGVGLGALIRSQVGAVVTAVVLYTAGTFTTAAIFTLIHNHLIEEDWVLRAQVLAPAVAAQVFVSAGKASTTMPEYWVGGLVLLLYGAVSGVVGSAILRMRDIS